MTQINNRQHKKKRLRIQVKSRLGRACVYALAVFLAIELSFLTMNLIVVPLFEYVFIGDIDKIDVDYILRGSLVSLKVGCVALILLAASELIDEWNDRRKLKKKIKDNKWNSDF